MGQSKQFSRVNTRVTRRFKMRLKWACTKRENDTARRVPEGEILSEFADQMEPHPDEGKTAGASKKGPQRETKKRAPRPAPKAISSAA